MRCKYNLLIVFCNLEITASNKHESLIITPIQAIAFIFLRFSQGKTFDNRSGGLSHTSRHCLTDAIVEYFLVTLAQISIIQCSQVASLCPAALTDPGRGCLLTDSPLDMPELHLWRITVCNRFTPPGSGCIQHHRCAWIHRFR
jgi:hypothetical protein